MQNPNELSILIATDNHLGYMENDPIRGNDSLNSFEEILQIAKDRQVDMILLAGDLYHDNKPSRKTTYKSMALLREYCLGSRPSSLAFMSDQSDVFLDQFAKANYLDPNYNVSIPVFSIHGNHDDPSGDGKYCALDLLSVTGLVNYFGKCSDVDDITIKPILLSKGKTNLALYGLGNVRDERLNRTFRRGNVKIVRPETDSWFNILAIHQNRVPRGGHEHDCLIDPVKNVQQDFFVSQPGSSIATSLSEGESKVKHVAILKLVAGKKFNFEKIRLKTVRPFICGEIELFKELGDKKDSTSVSMLLKNKVKELIQIAYDDFKILNQDINLKNNPELYPKPLIRLKVDYSNGFDTINPTTFGREYVDIVANPKDILLFHRKKIVNTPVPESIVKNPIIQPKDFDETSIEQLVSLYLNAQALSILPENKLFEAVDMFVEKDDKDAIKEFVKMSVDATRVVLKEMKISDDQEEIRKSSEIIKLDMAAKFNTAGKKLVLNTKKSAAATKKKPVKKGSKVVIEKSESEEESEEEVVKPVKKGKRKKVEESEEDEEEVIKPSKISKPSFQVTANDFSDDDVEIVASSSKAKAPKAKAKAAPKAASRKLPFAPAKGKVKGKVAASIEVEDDEED